MEARRIFINVTLISLLALGSGAVQVVTAQSVLEPAFVDMLPSLLLGNGSVIAAGNMHTCVITLEGGVKCWGENQKGQLGNGVEVNSAVPVDVIGLMSGVLDISVGGMHSCAVTQSDGVKCWGSNEFGQLGDGSQGTFKSTQVSVVGLPENITAIAAGQQHTCVLIGTSDAKCWGDNSAGQLGNATRVDSSTATEVVDLPYGIVDLVAGGKHNCILTENGGVYCWGDNEYGQLGDGSLVASWKPVKVTDLSTGVIAITAGESHTCALLGGGTVKCWGADYGDKLEISAIPVDVPSLTNDIKAISAGQRHTCALTSDALVKCWGDNEYSQLGEDSQKHIQSSIILVNGLPRNTIAVAAGGRHTCVLSTISKIRCWGDGEYGQLGNRTFETSPVPVEVVKSTPPEQTLPPVDNVASLVAGDSHTCVLGSDGEVQCWGENTFGQLGNGTSGHDSPMPVGVVGLSSGVTALAAGGRHTCALTALGGVKCWGDNSAGQLGSSILEEQSFVPVDVVTLTGGVLAITAGWRHTCILMVGGAIKCWGDNKYGQLGNDTVTKSSRPLDMVWLSTAVVAIVAGGEHTCALTSDAAVKCWGNNQYGQLGNGKTKESAEPVDVVGLSSGVTSIISGYSHTCVLMEDDMVKCWGSNHFGQLGVNTSGNTSLLPVALSELPNKIIALSAGSEHTCALTVDGGVKCWGNNWDGQLGDGTLTERVEPVDVIGFSDGAAAIAGGSAHTCALTVETTVRCWGANQHRELGLATDAVVRTTPVEILANIFTAISAGDNHNCTLNSGGGVRCWGDNQFAQLSNEDIRYSAIPMNVSDLGFGVTLVAAGGDYSCALTSRGDVLCWGHLNVNYSETEPELIIFNRATDIAVGEEHACALVDEGKVLCWGKNDFGQLGNGTTVDSSRLVDVTGLESAVVSITAGDQHTCVIMDTGGVKCWGKNISGQLGDDTGSEYSAVPVDVVGLSLNVSVIAAGGQHTCALSKGGSVRCWGANWYGQLGDGTYINRLRPVIVSGLLSGVTAISAGGYHTCALMVSSRLQCWGNNQNGQLGDGTIINRKKVARVGDLIGVVTVTAGERHTCVLNVAGEFLCWGWNKYGQLGDGTTMDRLKSLK